MRHYRRAGRAAHLEAVRPLPEGYDLDTDALLNREAWALIEVVEKDGTIYNRIAQLFPLRALVLADTAAPAPLPEADEAPW